MTPLKDGSQAAAENDENMENPPSIREVLRKIGREI